MAVPWLDASQAAWGDKSEFCGFSGILCCPESQGAKYPANSNRAPKRYRIKSQYSCPDPKTKQTEAQSLVDGHLNFVGKTGGKAWNE